MAVGLYTFLQAVGKEGFHLLHLNTQSTPQMWTNSVQETANTSSESSSF